VSANAPGLLVIERILRDRQGIWQQVVEDRGLSTLTIQMLTSSAAALAVYGAVLGSFHSVLMALTSAVKLPLLFLVTLAICLPTLYLFNLVFGARLSVRQSLSMVMVAITVTSMLALAFAPISLFFLITAPDYGFFKLLNVAILALSALVGLRFLTGGMRVLNDHGLLAPAPPVVAPAPAVVPPPVPATVPAQLVPAGAPADDVVAGRRSPNRHPARQRHGRGRLGGGQAAVPARRAPAGPGAPAARPASAEHDAAARVDPAVRFRRHPVGVDAAAVLRQPGGAVRALPQDRRQFLRRDRPYAREPVLTFRTTAPPATPAGLSHSRPGAARNRRQSVGSILVNTRGPYPGSNSRRTTRGSGRQSAVGVVLLDRPFGREDITQVRHQVAALLTDAGLTGDRLHGFVLAVNEVITNVVLHGGGQGRLVLRVDGGAAHCAVSDAGPGIPAHLRSAPVAPDTSEVGGRGIWLAYQLCDEVTMDSGEVGTTIGLQILLPERVTQADLADRASSGT
jgi:anti-sigma regulatory factor (Ser/Thr protein kinase)